MNAPSKVVADPIAQLETALASALPTLEGAKKNSENPAFKSGGKAIRYADLGSVIDAIRPIAEHGIWFRQVLHEGERGVTVETLYTGFGATISAGTLFMPADKANAQGYGSALTYARRYALQTAFGLSTEDDDGNEASKHQDAPREERPEPQPERISKAQWSTIIALLESTNSNAAAILKHFKVDDLKKLTAAQAIKVINQLEDKLAGMAKNESNKSLADELGDEVPF